MFRDYCMFRSIEWGDSCLYCKFELFMARNGHSFNTLLCIICAMFAGLTGISLLQQKLLRPTVPLDLRCYLVLVSTVNAAIHARVLS